MADQIGVTLLVLILAGCLVATVWLFISHLRERRKAYDALESTVSEPKESPARVAAIDSQIHKWGTKFPQHKIIYSAVFDLDNGETKEFSSDTPLFEGLNVGQIGILIYCEDTFLGFADLEEGNADGQYRK